MAVFHWIVLCLAGLLLLGSGVCGVVFLVVENSDWRRLTLRLFRLSMVALLFWMNVSLYRHLVSSAF